MHWICQQTQEGRVNNKTTPHFVSVTNIAKIQHLCNNKWILVKDSRLDDKLCKKRELGKMFTSSDSLVRHMRHSYSDNILQCHNMQ